MRESRTYGSVRGALSNERPYRDRPHVLQQHRGAQAAVPTRVSREEPLFFYCCLQ
jgi:hypothetical protein